jgi:iron complex outermembrane receptor protein
MATEAKSFDIPAQDLESALLRFGLQSGKQIVFETGTLQGLKSQPVRGHLSSEQALRMLIAGMPVTARNDRSDLIVIVPAQKAAPVARPIALAQAPVAVQAPAEVFASAAPDQGLEEIIVTAEKREASLQKTPIAISVLGSADLRKQGLASISDLKGGAVPSLQLVPLFGVRPSALVLGMRGVVPNDPTQVTRDSGVGIYIDGVYLGRVQGLGTKLVDPERIEILKGPQGTLFGRNAVGGALSIVTKKPTGEWGGEVTGGFRNFDGRNIAAHINLPAIADISVKVDGVYSARREHSC